MGAHSYWCPTCQLGSGGYTAPDGGAVLCRGCGEILVDRPADTSAEEADTGLSEQSLLADLARGYEARSGRVQRMADELADRDDEFNQRCALTLEGEANAYHDVAENLSRLATVATGSTPTTAEPTLGQLTAAVQDALDPALMHVTVTQDGHTVSLHRMVRVLDKAGLLDWAAITTPDEETRHG